jgi:hypothetical protein
MSRSVPMFMFVSMVLSIAFSVGCGAGGNQVIDQPEDVMTEQFKSEESAVGNGKPVET